MEAEFFALQTAYIENPNDQEKYSAFFNLAKRREEVKTEIHELEKRVYSLQFKTIYYLF